MWCDCSLDQWVSNLLYKHTSYMCTYLMSCCLAQSVNEVVRFNLDDVALSDEDDAVLTAERVDL